MLRNDIIKSSKSDRKAYQLFVILGSIYDEITKVGNLDAKVVNNDDDIVIATAIRNSLISLNDIDFNFFREVMDFIIFLDKTAVFEREEYTGNDIVTIISNILEKMKAQFSWFKDVAGQPMSQEEIKELLSYDCDLESLANV